MKSPTLMTQSRVRLDEIVVRDRLRSVSEAGVESLLASIAEIGVMKDAIHVRKKKDGKLWLIAGGHRLEAARRLGWDEIEAKVWTDVTDDWARLMEIDDNLAGAEMNPLDTAWFLATRKIVYERLHPETKADAFKGNRHTGSLASDIVSFARATAEKFGVSKRHVERMIAAGSRLGPDELRRLRRAPRQVTLKDLGEIAKIGEPTEKYAVVEFLELGVAKTAAEARRMHKTRDGQAMPVKDPVEDAFKALMNAWSRAPMAARRRFVHEVSDDLAAMEGQSE